MRRWKKILLGVLVALVLLIGALCLWQWNNIPAVYTFLTLDSAEIAQNLEQQREEHHQAIQEKVELTIAPPSTEQSDAILSGQATPEEVKEALGITEQLKKTEEAEPGNTAPAYTEQELVNSCVAELYACKIDIMEVLAELKKEAVNEWNALPEEARNDAKLREIGMAGLEDCYDLEVTVDNQVEAILEKYRPKLKELGADTGILDTLWKYYCDEKAAEKAYYLDKYMR